LARDLISHADAIAYITRRLLFMYAHAEKCHSSAKKLLNLNFLLFKKIFFVKLIVTYLKKKGKLNNFLSNRIYFFFCVHACVYACHHKFSKKVIVMYSKKEFISFVEYYKILSKKDLIITTQIFVLM